MPTKAPNDTTLCVIRAPYASASVHYRAYSETLISESVLAWLLNRIVAGLPKGTSAVCVCDTESERERLAACAGTSAPVQFVSMTAQDEPHLLRLIIGRYRAERLIVAGFGHAVAPSSLPESLLKFHCALHAEITDTSSSPFVDSLYVVEASLVELLCKHKRPARLDSVMGGVALLAAFRQNYPNVMKEIRWLRMDFARQLRVERKCLPDRITVSSTQDVSVLRSAILAQSSNDSSAGLMYAWKRAAIALRERSLTTNPSRPLPRPVRPGRIARILYASSASSFTGGQQSLCHLVGDLDRSRYFPLALVSHTGTFVDELRRRGVEVICPEDSIGDGKIDNVMFANDVIARYKPDLIHANHAVGLPLTAVALAHGVPFVQHVRVATPRDLLSQIYAADAVIAVSEFVRERVLELDVDRKRTEVIWNGVNIEDYRPNVCDRATSRVTFGILPGEFVVAMIARMRSSKRHDVVIAAVKRMRETTGRGRLIILGAPDGDPTYAQAIRAQIDRDGLRSCVSITEFMADVRPVLCASDVLVIPSVDEPLSRAALEAMAVGLPVIVGDSGGTREVVVHGRTGFVVSCGDILSLARKLCELASDRSMGVQVGLAAAEYIRRSLTSKHCAERTMAVYDRVLARGYV